MIGQTIGSYRVTAKLGSGGMGDVYRATDTRLGRDVAIKFPAERLTERFEREARAVAALNHPNICTLYDVAPNYLVMELVEGVTLADRIVEGPLPLDEALGIARQIAAALEEAHDKGITHRDLKPSNIKIRPDGTVKVLDFGLAKLAVAGANVSSDGGDQAAASLSLSPTMSVAATQAGVIIGTAAYMAPEQARGKPVDKRADIWAFGVVLYEMLAGRPPFRGEDVGDVLASVIKEEPSWESVPTQVRPLLERCLQKDPKKRLRDISGVGLLLDAGVPARTVARPRSAFFHYAVEGTLALALAVAIWLLWPRPAAQRPFMHFEVDLGPDVILGSLRGSDVTISADGNRLAFVSQGRLFTRRLDQDNAIEFPNVQGAYAPFFSPDGQWIGFFSNGLKKIHVTGGSPIALADGAGFGGTWANDGSVVASLDSRGLTRIPEAGGGATSLTTLGDGENSHLWPQLLPNGKAVVFSVRRSDGDEIRVLTLDDRRTKVIQRGGSFGRYLARNDKSGYLLFMNGNTILGVAFDPDALETRGTPAPLVENVGSGTNPLSRSAQFDVSRNGTLVYRNVDQNSQLAAVHVVDSMKHSQPLSAKPDVYSHPRVSPDGRKVALTVRSQSSQDIWVYDSQRGNMLRLTYGDAEYQFPVWTTDGRFIVFSSGITGSGMFWTRADGASRPQQLTESKSGQFPWSFSPDGKRLGYAEFPRGGGDIWTVPVSNDGGSLKAGKPELFLQTSANELYPAFSPNGRWVAYRSFESGRSEIYVRAFPDTSGKWLISNGTGDGIVPIWSPTGNELFYRTDDQRIMAVAYAEQGNAFFPEKPRLWSEVRLIDSGQRNLDILPNGKGFVALLPADNAAAPTNGNRTVLLLNFADEIARRMGPSNTKLN